MKQYLDLLQHILDHGTVKSDRTGTGTKSVFGYQMRFDLSEGFPLLTTKKLHLRSIIYELLWFIKGDTNIKYLHDHKVSIWDEWADENGTHSSAARTRGGTSSQPGIRRRWTVWPCPPATPSSSSTWPTGGSPASSTSAVRMSSSECRSTSPPMPC